MSLEEQQKQQTQQNQQFSKEIKKCESEIKEQINKIIKNEGHFCCMSKDISIIIPDKSEEAEPTDTLTKYLPIEDGNKMMSNLFLEVLKSKELNPKALEQMKAKGITPKPQPMDILLIIVIPSEKTIKIGISIPKTMDLDITSFCSKSLVNINYNIELVNDKLAFIDYKTEFELKEIDNAIRLFFNQLKVEGIYSDDEPDEEYVNYLEEMS
jgi:hypothetical protein